MPPLKIEYIQARPIDGKYQRDKVIDKIDLSSMPGCTVRVFTVDSPRGYYDFLMPKGTRWEIYDYGQTKD